MSSNVITVWGERQGSVELVGRIAAKEQGICFSYDPDYAGPPISCSVPKEAGRLEASPSVTSAFFSALIPEGSARTEFANMLHAERGEFVPYLERLGDESIGFRVRKNVTGHVYEGGIFEQKSPARRRRRDLRRRDGSLGCASR